MRLHAGHAFRMFIEMASGVDALRLEEDQGMLPLIDVVANSIATDCEADEAFTLVVDTMGYIVTKAIEIRRAKRQEKEKPKEEVILEQ